MFRLLFAKYFSSVEYCFVVPSTLNWHFSSESFVSSKRNENSQSESRKQKNTQKITKSIKETKKNMQKFAKLIKETKKYSNSFGFWDCKENVVLAIWGLNYESLWLIKTNVFGTGNCIVERMIIWRGIREEVKKVYFLDKFGSSRMISNENTMFETNLVWQPRLPPPPGSDG